MLELKAFVQESVHALDDTQLHLLSQTLRVDLRGCDDRRDIERVLTGLLCLDKDTALGTFLTWLRTRETHPQSHGLLARKHAFLNTFVPVLSPRKAAEKPHNNNGLDTADALANVKSHHLNEEISQRLDELKLLEQDFKDAERQVHNGAPTFEKLKAFLLKLTKLRAMEEDVRRFFIRQSELLTQQHAQMKEETLHTRNQLDFFVNGFTNLRYRHDELVEKSTQMKAEDEAAQEIFLSITAQESHFGAVLHCTMLHQLEEKRVLTSQLEDANDEIQQFKAKQQHLEQLISRLKQQRGDALKDASSYKQQLRKCKQKMDWMVTDGPDCAFFRQQAIQLRGALTTLLTLFKESIARDTKSAKQTVSKEVLRTMQSVLLASPAASSSISSNSVEEMRADRGATGVLFYNYELSSHEANLLIGAGLPIDCVVELKLPPPPCPKVVPAPAATPTTTKSLSKPSTGARAPASSSRTPSSSSPSRPASKATSSSSSPSRPSSRQGDSKKLTSTPATPATGRSAAMPSSLSRASQPKIERRAVFASMPHAFAQLEPVAFVEGRVDQILEELVRQKRKRAMPFVVWDDATSQVNESLLMYAEDIHMMLWVEQDSRKPKKPGQDTPSPSKPGTPASSKAGSSPTRGVGAQPGGKAPVKAAAKGKAASPTRGSSKATSPAKLGAKAKPTSPSKPATAKPSSPGKPRASVSSASSVSPQKPLTASLDTKKRAASVAGVAPPSRSPPKRKA